MYDFKKSIDSSYGFKDPCESSPCLHSGHCLVFNAKSGFTCSCSHGYTGKLCEISKTNKFTWEMKQYSCLVSKVTYSALFMTNICL